MADSPVWRLRLSQLLPHTSGLLSTLPRNFLNTNFFGFLRNSLEFGTKHNFVLRNAVSFLCLSIIAHALGNVARNFFTLGGLIDVNSMGIVLTKAWFLVGTSFRQNNVRFTDTNQW